MYNSLLVSLLKTHWSLDALENVKLYFRSNEINWDQLLGEIKTERLGGMIYSLFHERNIFPLEYEHQLREEYYKTLHQNLIHTQVLDAGLKALSDTPVIVLKGAAFITTLYRNPGLRPMSDVDILVNKNVIKQSFERLMNAGFDLVEPEINPDLTWDFAGEIALLAPANVNAYLELHWHLCNSVDFQRKIHLDSFWQRTQKVNLGGKEALVFSPEAQIVYLCTHCSLHHGGKGMLFWNDIAEVIVQSANQLDWDEVLFLAEFNQLGYPLQQILPNLAVDWAVPIPSEIIFRITSWSFSKNEVARFDQLAHYEQAPASMNILYTLQTLPDLRSKITFGLRHAFPSPVFMKSRYNIQKRWQLPFYYPYRWLRGLRRQMG